MKKLFLGMLSAVFFVSFVLVTRYVVAESLYGDATSLDEAPLLISSDPSLEVFSPTDTVDIVYTFENPSDGPGTVSVILGDFVPDWAVLTDDPFSDTDDFSYSSSDSTASFSLESGATAYVSFSYRVADPALTEQILSYGLSTRYSYQDSAATMDYTTVLQYTSSLALVGDALDLKLHATVSPSLIKQGDNVTFIYTVTNNEMVALPSEAAVLAQLPNDFSLIFANSSTTSALTTTEYESEEGVLSIHNFLPGGVVTLVLVAEYTGDTSGGEIVQDIYLTHSYFFSSHRDAEGNFIETPSAVDFSVVDSDQVVLTLATTTLPYTASGSVTPDTFDGGDSLDLSYTFSPNEPNGEMTWMFSRGEFLVEIPDGMTPTDVVATWRSMTGYSDGAWGESTTFPFSDEEASWSFDAGTNVLTWNVENALPLTFDQGMYYEFAFSISVTTDADIADSAFVFPGTLTLVASSASVPAIADQVLSAMPTATRNVPVTLPEPEATAYESPSSSGGGGGGSSGSSSSSGEELTYAIYIVNPDGTIRSSEGTYSGYSLIHSDRYGIITFDDSGEDMDLNDVVVQVDSRDCDAATFSVQEVNASWEHQVGIAIFHGDTQLANYILFENDHTSLGSAKELDLESLLDSGETCRSAKVLHEDGVENGGCVQTCDTLATEYYLSILNPDGTRRETFTPYVEIDRKGNRMFTLNFEDSGYDSDYNDVILDLDVSNCRDMQVTGVSVDADWHHAVYGTMYYNGILVSDEPIVADSHTLVGQTVTIDADDDLVMCIAE